MPTASAPAAPEMMSAPPGASARSSRAALIGTAMLRAMSSPCASAGSGAARGLVARDLGLTVHHDLLAAGQRLHVDAVALALEQHVKAAVQEALLVHARAHAGFVEQVHADLLKHAGADAGQHVVWALTLDQDGVNAGLVKQLPEQQAGRAAADDGDLGPLLPAGGVGWCHAKVFKTHCSDVKAAWAP